MALVFSADDGGPFGNELWIAMPDAAAFTHSSRGAPSPRP